MVDIVEGSATFLGATVRLHIAQQKSEEGIVNAVKAWLDNVVLPSPFIYCSLYID